MSERLASDLLFIIIALLIAAILGFLVGYFLCRRKARSGKTLNESTNEAVEDTVSDHTAEPEVMEKSYMTQENRAAPEITEVPEFDAELAKSVFGKRIISDDLKIVEGIGPVIEGILKRNHIDSWQKLAESDAGKIRSILIAEGGPRYRIHDPLTWPQQAGLAFKGQWEDLKELQDGLRGGRVIE
ncbi:MAG: hypothetical protein JXR52_02770 [Bacteroidales bacterium]|nr:hypothetical protein [Bacteroidales bacterium]MBN2697723.1 hypothetical protein [Bacteroidales bacterium]